MHLPSSLVLLAASLSMGMDAGKGKGNGKNCKGLDVLAKKAGLKYFGAATDSPGQRERAGYEEQYPQYDQIMWDSGEFGQTTPTNGQKWLFVEPTRGVFNYTEGDIVTSLAKKHGMYLRCHALVWHSQLAPWVESTTWTADELRKVIVEHVTKVARHWKGQCYAWDVVNEALNEDGTYRESVFYNVLGEEYIKLAFKTAAEVDPKAKLYYNDYNLESPSGKTAGAQRIVKMLQAEGIKVDGVGLQAHLIAENHPTLDQHIDAIQGFADLGVEVALTELDIRLTVPATAENLAQQKEAYKNVVGACVQVEGCIGVTLWDFYDPFSWVPYVFPTEGAATLWFEDFAKHPAYDGVVEALTNKTSRGKGKGKGKGGKRANLWTA
ncbi:glycoside hydrolase family 10 protein [Parathielavia hyrcaniae]|uniref:Beta-xylanase n=1 Tax=Parathielavia hyrcaniae TaxID=113614 RepID=A0AAN6QAE5_9PEZI|nr:glycoside hydrolase family 10 protein [Parathielavia hyrcaniae]